MRTIHGVTLALALCAIGTFAETARAQDFEGQIKINFIDTTQAPKIRVYASLLKRRAKPPGEKELTGVTLYRKPDKSAPVRMFAFKDGDIVWDKDVTEDEKKKKEKDGTLPVLASAGELETGAAIMVVAPGFEDAEYKNGTLGERSRNGAGLFFKKLGKTHKMNALWYSDFVYGYVYAEGRLSELAKLDQYLPICRKWERDQARHFGMTAEEAAAADGAEPPDPKAPVVPKKGEARCGLTGDYAEIGKIIAKTPYDGFWPQLFGLSQHLCTTPDHPIKKTSMRADADEGSRLTAIDTAFEMLVRGAEPGQPRILILTGDGRDCYVNAPDDCRTKYSADCQTRVPADAPERSKALKTCVDDQLQKDAAGEQGVFAKKLPTWLGIAKAADIRIYSVIHPTAPKYARERLELLSWRTGGTPRFAEDANEVLDRYDELIRELNGQIVLTFVDPEATPDTLVNYVVEGHLGSTKYTSEAFSARTPPAVERSLIYEFKTFGQKKLGKVGFMAALIGVGLLVLLLLLKIVKKIAKKGDGVVKAGAKGAKSAQGAVKKGGDAAKKVKEKAKLIEKAKKAKEAQKKALEKAKKKTGG